MTFSKVSQKSCVVICVFQLCLYSIIVILDVMLHSPFFIAESKNSGLIKYVIRESSKNKGSDIMRALKKLFNSNYFLLKS